MCQGLKSAIDVLKTQPRNGGLSKAEMMIFEKVVEDNKKMGDRMTKLEEKVGAVEDRLNSVDKKLDDVLKLLDRPLWNNLKEVLSNKMFIYLIITLTCLICGVSVGQIGTFIFK